MNKKFIFIFLTTLLQLTIALSQDTLTTDLPFLRKVELRARISFDNSSGLYSYHYVLSNDIQNIGRVWIFSIDISLGTTSTIYDTIGLRFRSPFVERMFRKRYPIVAQSIVPVGFPTLPGLNWTAEVDRNFTASFDVDERMPKPGENIGGFVMTSKALPGIRRLMVLPWFEEALFFPNIEDTTATMTEAQMDSIRNAVNFYGWTVGPYAPPATFDANVLLDTLTSFTARSRVLGWLKAKKEDEKDKDDGELKELDKRLAEVRTALVKGDSSKVRKELEEFVEKVEELRKESEKAEEKKKEQEIVMTSEAYALLKYNAEYLINKLPKKKK